MQQVSEDTTDLRDKIKSMNGVEEEEKYEMSRNQVGLDTSAGNSLQM